MHSDSSLIQNNEKLSEASIEEKMKSLPHWKYAAAFENYITA